MLSLYFLGVEVSAEGASLENKLEMVLLAHIGDIDDSVAFEGLDAITDRSHVGGVVVVTAIRLLYHEWHFLSRQEDANSTVILHSNTSLTELFNHGGQEGVVETFAHLCTFDVQTLVDLVELYTREGAKLFPSCDDVLVSSLKLHHVCAGTCLEFRLGIKSLLGVLVECLQVGDLWGLVEEVGEGIIKLRNKHAELCTPVSHMVVTDHIMSEELENTTNTVSLNSRTQVTHMHVFSDIGGREID